MTTTEERDKTMRKVYERSIDWLINHSVVIYTVGIALIVFLVLYGMVSEHGFRAQGY